MPRPWIDQGGHTLHAHALGFWRLNRHIDVNPPLLMTHLHMMMMGMSEKLNSIMLPELLRDVYNVFRIRLL
jgi:hypothetical protein